MFGAMKGDEVLPSLDYLFDALAADEELLGITIPSLLNCRFDSIPNEPIVDYELIGVDKGGIYLYLHPEVILAMMDDELAYTISIWRRGGNAENVYQCDILQILKAARLRRDNR